MTTKVAQAAQVSSNVKEIEEEDLSSEFADLVEENFAELEDEGQSTQESEVPAPAEPAEEAAQAVQPQTTTEPEQTPATESVVQQPTQAQAPASAPAQQPVAQQPAGEQTPQPTTDLNAQYQEFFSKSVDALEKSVYALPPEVIEELDMNPSKVLPKLAATLHMQVLSAALAQVSNLFPSLMTLHNDQVSHTRQTEEKFFSEYPALRDHGPLVSRIAAAYRQMNPTATYEQIAPEVAAMAMVQARIPTTPASVEPPVKPAIPTSARGAAPVRATQGVKSTWDELIEGE